MPVRPGIYNEEYFSGSQAAIYIGDVWVDEITSLSYAVHQNRTPLYGYASQLWDDVSEGPVLVQGEFTINFKEAGYLWLILNRYRETMTGNRSLISPFKDTDEVSQRNIEQLINGEVSTFRRNELYKNLASEAARELMRAQTSAQLGGFASIRRSSGYVGKFKQGRKKGQYDAESVFEHFENEIWRKTNEQLDAEDRRADDPRLNPFDIYIAFGDFAGDDRANHTIQKITDVHILGSSKRIVVDGQPIQEAYSFIGRNLV